MLDRSMDFTPPSVEAWLMQAHEKADAVFMSDMLPDGSFGEEAVAVTDRKIRVFKVSAGQAAVCRWEQDLSAIQSCRLDNLVGGGALLVSVGGETLELVRFSNACQKPFSRLIKYLNDWIAFHKKMSAGETAEKPILAKDPEERKRCPKCRLLLPEHTQVCPACLDKSRVLLRLSLYLKPYWGQVLVVTFLVLAGMALSLIPPYLTRPLVDQVLLPQNADKNPVERLALLGWLVAGLLVSQVVGSVFSIYKTRMLVAMGAALSHDLRLQLYSHLQMMSVRFFEKSPVGAMMSRVIQDTESLENVMVDGIQYFVANILMLIGIGAVLFVLNWKMALLVLIPVPLCLWGSHRFVPFVIGMWRRTWHYRSRLSSSVTESLSGARVVKAFAREQSEITRFVGHSQAYQTSSRTAQQMWAIFFPIMWLVMSAGTLLVWYVGGREIIGGRMTLGVLMTFLAYLGMFYGPLNYLSRMADYLARSLAAAERVFEVLDRDPDVKESDDAVSVCPIQGHVEFNGVTFGYESHLPILKNFSLDVAPGEMIGFVGHSGAGKSTTMSLVCRFYDVNQGEIKVDGVDIRKIRQQDLRSQIGVVLQDTFLFNGTIAENIAFARPEATPAEIMAAAKAANAHDFIVSKPDGYDSKVGERGQALSGGERQRVAIARAVLHNPRILILDEATASVDTDTEKQIQEAIARLIKGRTTFAIAHRLSTLRNANRLVVLKDGAMAEAGTHEELMAKKGEFYRLVEMQREMSSVMAVGGKA